MKGSRIYLDLLKIFADLAQTKSFSKTASQNYLTQSAVSQQVSFLERIIGKKLVVRGKGQFSLTEQGEIFLEGCKKMLAAYDETLQKIQKPGEISGSVRVETVYSIGLHGLNLYVKTFLQRYPKVNLHIGYSRSDRIYADVIQGVCDIGIVSYPWEHHLIRMIPFKKVKMVMVCSPQDPLAKNPKVSLKELEQKKFIAFDRDIPTRKAVDEILRKFKVFVRVIHEFDNVETLKRDIEVGSGISILPENTVLQEVKSKTLVALPFREGAFLRPTGIICRQGKELSRAAQAFIHWLTK